MEKENLIAVRAEFDEDLNENFVKVPNEFFKLGLKEFVVAFYLLELCRSESSESNLNEIAKELSISKSTLIRRLKKIEEKGFLKRSGKGRNTVYSLVWE